MKQRDVLLILISTFIIVVCWIAFNVVHNSITSTISENLAVQIIPISPNFDTQAIERIKKRQKISPLYEIDNQSSLPITATPSSPIMTISPSPVSSTSTILLPSTTLSSSGGQLQ